MYANNGRFGIFKFKYTLLKIFFDLLFWKYRLNMYYKFWFSIVVQKKKKKKLHAIIILYSVESIKFSQFVSLRIKLTLIKNSQSIVPGAGRGKKINRVFITRIDNINYNKKNISNRIVFFCFTRSHNYHNSDSARRIFVGGPR